MTDVTHLLTAVLAIYALVMGVFLISENRTPQATLAWMLAFIFLPGIGALAYLFFGRDGKAFSRQSKLLRQDLRANAIQLLNPIPSRQDTELDTVESANPRRRKLAMMLRRN